MQNLGKVSTKLWRIVKISFGPWGLNLLGSTNVLVVPEVVATVDAL